MRDKAVESLRKIADKHSTAALEEHFVPMLKRLATGMRVTVFQKFEDFVTEFYYNGLICSFQHDFSSKAPF